MRRRLKRLFVKEDGSVSVYLIAILLPVFLFHAVLIDLVRYELAERQTERAVKAAARSVMSEYETPLREYGLFGRDDDTAEMNELFASILERNFVAKDRQTGFAYLDIAYQAGSGSVSPLYSLGNQQILRDQVNEDMKYQAPIEFALGLVDKFRKPGSLEGMDSASELYDHSTDLEKRWEELNNQLDKCWKQARELSEKAKSTAAGYESKLEELKALSDKTGLTTAVEVEKSISEIGQSITAAQNSLTSLAISMQQQQSSLTELKKHAKQNAAKIKELQSSIAALDSQMSELRSSLNELDRRKESAQQLLKDLADYAVKAAASRSEMERDQTELTRLGRELNQEIGIAQNLNTSLRKEKERLIAETAGDSTASRIYQAVPVLSDDYFMHYQIDSGKAVSSFSALAIHWKAAAFFTGADYDSLKTAREEVAKLADQFIARQEPLETARMAKRKNQTEQQKNAESDLKKLLSGSSSIAGTCTDTNSEAYRRLSGTGDNGDAGLYGKYMRLNQAGSIEEGTGGLQSADDSTARTNIKKALSFGKRVQNLLASARGELYLNEYAMQRFSYRTADLSSYANRPLAGQEGEYILYGFNSCQKNNAAAYGEMYLLLFGIRTTEAMLDPKNELLNVGSPLLVLLVAAVEGAGQAVRDMEKLTDGKAIPLIKKMPAVTVTYADFLRLFFLLHSSDKKMMARIQGLIELNTGLDLAHQTTYVKATAQSSFRLWFLPKVAATLGKAWKGAPGGLFQVEAAAVMTY
ncbi:hypothetical protein [Gorillibacterium sp. sgz500922]|uniref:hypothetical protein n=1 Tax=Gorillibacterium sp. sgz500922 TaxID=3446694 RepID=UPI003F6773D9